MSHISFARRFRRPLSGPIAALLLSLSMTGAMNTPANADPAVSEKTAGVAVVADPAVSEKPGDAAVVADPAVSEKPGDAAVVADPVVSEKPGDGAVLAASAAVNKAAGVEIGTSHKAADKLAGNEFIAASAAANKSAGVALDIQAKVANTLNSGAADPAAKFADKAVSADANRALADEAANITVDVEPIVVEKPADFAVKGATLPVRQWSENTAKPKGILITIHGAARHGGTFQTLAEHFAAEGYLVLAPDLRGYGQWYYCNASHKVGKVVDYDRSVDDIVELVDSLRNKNPQIPIFCLGESAGAAVAVRVAARCPAVNGLILSALGTRPCVHDLGTVFEHVLAGACNFDKPLDCTKFLSNYASDDSRVREEVMTDSYGRNSLSARELLRTSDLIRSTPKFAAELPAHIPVLMLQGSDDEVVRPSSAGDVLRRIHSTAKRMIHFPCGHIMLATRYIRPDVLHSVDTWIGARTGEQQTALLTSNHLSPSAQHKDNRIN